jgi:hypothetical protein
MKWLLIPLVLLAGCSTTEVRVDSGSTATRTQGALQVQFEGGRGLATLLGLTVLTAAMFDYERGRPDLAPALAPERRINEQDCTKPIDYSLGNLRCK